MEKLVQIDIEKEEDLFEKYNKNVVSNNLINYLIETTPDFSKNDTIKVTINTKNKLKENCISLIRDGLKEEYKNNTFKYHNNNLKQILFLLIGILILLITKIIEGMILEELASVGVWVVFWNMIETELYEDREIKKKKRIIKKLLNSEFIIADIN